MKRKMQQGIYILLGFLFLGVGMIGVFLPILPTTPFLLIASFFFARGSKRFHRWFQNTNIYKRYLDDFIQTKSMTLKAKWMLLLPVSLLLGIVFLFTPICQGKLILVIVIVVKYYYFFFRITTVKEI